MIVRAETRVSRCRQLPSTACLSTFRLSCLLRQRSRYSFHNAFVIVANPLSFVLLGAYFYTRLSLLCYTNSPLCRLVRPRALWIRIHHLCKSHFFVRFFVVVDCFVLFLFIISLISGKKNNTQRDWHTHTQLYVHSRSLSASHTRSLL